MDFLFSFSDLPGKIDHKWNQYWKIIQQKLTALDTISARTSFNGHRVSIKGNSNSRVENQDVLSKIANNIKGYLVSSGDKRVPDYIRLGTLGSGNNPNYQIYFTDGSVKAFHFTGSPHRLLEFKSLNLGSEIKWDRIKF